MNKVILLDNSVFVHRAIFSWASMIRLKNAKKIAETAFIPPVAYTYFSMIVSSLIKIGVKKDDIIIMAQDGRDSWRKDYYAPYKANRTEFRESHEEINWKEKYAEIGVCIDQLKAANLCHWIQIPKIEADDVIAVACNKFQDMETIVVSIDKDLEQLCYYPNVRIYSLMTKYKGLNGSYKIVKNPLKIISDKAKKGDVSDNILVDKENDTPEDYELREYIINLIRLPDFVTNTVKHYLEDLRPLELDEAALPYQSSIAKKIGQIYNSEKVITYEDVVKFHEGKEERTKKRNIKLKKAASKSKVSLR